MESLPWKIMITPMPKCTKRYCGVIMQETIHTDNLRMPVVIQNDPTDNEHGTRPRKCPFRSRRFYTKMEGHAYVQSSRAPAVHRPQQDAPSRYGRNSFMHVLAQSVATAARSRMEPAVGQKPTTRSRHRIHKLEQVILPKWMSSLSS